MYVEGLVSIVIPVYNAEDYLRRCLDSILEQSYRDIEIILVNDGSKDDSSEVCKYYQNLDSRIKYFYKENGGASSARNYGIDKARGEFITFVDADDWLSNDAIEVQSSHMRSDKLDLLIFDPYVCSKNIAPVALREAAGAAWRCCYRTDFIRQNNILFPEGIKLSEDCIFNLIALGKAKRIKYIDNCLYFYFINEDGAVKSYHYDYPEIVYDAHQVMGRGISGCFWENIFIQLL